jgi:hypothetical protein
MPEPDPFFLAAVPAAIVVGLAKGGLPMGL